MKLWRKERSFFYALHPEEIPASSARFTFTFGLGGITVLATLITLVTGLFLSFYYIPTTQGAHASVVFIDGVVSFGAFLRALHYWAAQLMVLGVTLHMARVVFTGGYRPPREVNWLIGLGLLVVTLLWDFTGYVLRWDDKGYWALTVGANLFRRIPRWGETIYRALVGDGQVGASALLRFYGWHVIGFTLLGIFGIVYHLWRVRKDGGISRPLLQNGEPRVFISRDELFFHEFVAATLVTAGLIFLSLIYRAPLGPAASANAEAEVRSPWIFLWVQQLLRHFPPLWAGIVAPLLMLLALASIPFIDRRGNGRAVWFARERWKPQALLIVLAMVIIALTLREVWP